MVTEKGTKDVITDIAISGFQIVTISALWGLGIYALVELVKSPPQIKGEPLPPDMEDVYRQESKNIYLSPYNMTNVNVISDSYVVSEADWQNWWLYYYEELPIVFPTTEYKIYLENGGHLAVSLRAYNIIQVGDRIIRWEYNTDRYFAPTRYDVWREGVLIYRRLSPIDAVEP